MTRFLLVPSFLIAGVASAIAQSGGTSLPPNVVLPGAYQAPVYDQPSSAPAQDRPGVPSHQVAPGSGTQIPQETIASPSQVPSSGSRVGETSFLDGHARVLDPGTLLVEGEVVGLAGVSGPQRDATCLDMTGMSYRCGERAARRLEQLVSGKRIRCEGTIDGQDVAVSTCRDGREDLARVLVRDGWGQSDGSFDREENEARSARRGMWAGSGPVGP